ncbi:hypothetical protein [Streptomyces sp. NPDC051776]|uniref:hypothetical protein n=1 Tax=Streptomyces sp. NPDC051776 TaxID=3155414 RepID=UPI00341DE216
MDRTGTGAHDNGGEDGARQGLRQALRREVPSTVALLAAEKDFAAMRRYTTFAFHDHAVYLREMEGLLRALSSQGVHTTVALFDPDEYAEFCTEVRLDPDRPDSRSRYTADVAGLGATLPYAGQPIDLLVPELLGEAERHAALDRATELLAAAGRDPDTGEDRGRAAYVRASQALIQLVEASGPGTHHVVCSVPVDGSSLVAVLHAACGEDGLVHLRESEALVFCSVLGAGIATGSRGGIVVRSTPFPRGGADGPGGQETAGPDVVRGWALRDGWPRPLSEAEVFAAYCTDVDTGDPVPPEHGVDHRPGIELPLPEGKW